LELRSAWRPREERVRIGVWLGEEERVEVEESCTAMLGTCGKGTRRREAKKMREEVGEKAVIGETAVGREAG
jgi:hypothetical protein